MTAPIGVFGKHPGYGDFIAHRVDGPVVTWFQAWLDSVLPQVRDGMGNGWDTGWDNAPILRFWIGRGVAGCTCVGVLIPSRDKVGRRYPLIVMAYGADHEAPIENPDQTIYERIEAAILGMTDDDDIKDIISSQPSCRSEDDTARATGPTLWAHHPEGDLEALLRSAGPQDAKRAITGRSYWWVPGSRQGHPAVWLGHAGLPDASTLGWLLFGQAAQLGQAQTVNHHEDGHA